MYALIVIVMFGMLATLMPFAVLPTPQPPTAVLPPMPVSTSNPDRFNKDNIEQYIVSMCSLRKVDGRTEIYPRCSNPAGCSVEALDYGDSMVSLAGVFGAANLKKTDGETFIFKQITARGCDASDFVL